MSLLCSVAALLGTDPVTLTVVFVMAGACANFMARVSQHSWSWLVYWPLLMIGGLAADDLAVAMSLYEVPSLAQGVDWDWFAVWAVMANTLPNILLAATAGMSLTGLALLALMRKVEDWS